MKTQEVLVELDQMEDRHLSRIVEDIESIRRQYPESFLLKTTIDLAKEQLKKDEAHINKHRQKYNSIKSFKERKDYYDNTLRLREEGYKICQSKLLKFLASPKVNSYEAWVTEYTYPRMKKHGYKDTVLHELLFGNLI